MKEGIFLLVVLLSALVCQSHDHGHHTLDDYFKTHLAWLTEDQQQQLRTLKGEGKPKAELQAKVFEFYDAATGDTKEKATELLRGGCRELLKSVIGEEKAKELKDLRESGTSAADLQQKVDEYVDATTDEHKKAVVTEYKGACKKVFGISRRRRDHHHGDHPEHEQTFEAYVEHHLGWLTAEQKAEVAKLKTDGKTRKEISDRVMEFYEATTGDKKTEAREQLKSGCRHLLHSVIGAEKAAEVKKLKESGASIETIEAKVQEFVNELDDEEKKQKAKDFSPNCKKLHLESQSRRRRHEHIHQTLEEYMEHHLGWLTDEQKDVIRKLKTDGKSSTEIQEKVLEYYAAAQGETKAKASEQLTSGCRELIVGVVGEAKAADLTRLRESGASMDELETKVDELVNAVTDEAKKEKAKEYGPACKKIYRAVAAANRKRRDHHHGHTLEDYFKSQLSWLTDEQKDAIRALKTEGKTKTDIQEKILEYFDAATGETKEKATELLKGGCRALLVSILGEDKATEIKQLKEGGASLGDIEAKINEYVAALDDDHKKQEAKDYGPACKKVFAVQSPSRKRRAEQTFEEYVAKFLAWLTDEQREAVKKLKADGGDKSAIQKKVLEFYAAATGEVKEKATQALQGGCKHILKSVIGEEKANVLKALKESGASKEDIAKKADEFIEAVQDEDKKQKAKEYAESCKKIFGVESRRLRRHERYLYSSEE